MNVPDDWNTYWIACPECNRRYHASEGGCDCAERRAEQFAQAVKSALPNYAGDIDVELPVVELSHRLSRRLGYHDDVPGPNTERCNLIAALKDIAVAHRVDIELCAYDDRAGESWTEEVIGGSIWDS